MAGSELEAELKKLAEKQAGAVSVEQAIALGISRDDFKQLRYHRLVRGVYQVPGAARTWDQKVWTALLETGGVASHRTAAWLWRLAGQGQWNKDQRQTSTLSSMGWRAIPCTWEDVTKNPEELRMKIERALAGYVSDGKFRRK